MGGPSLLSFLTPSSHHPMGILSCSGSGHRRNLSRGVSSPPLPSPVFAAPGNDASTRQSTKSLVHPHFPRCYPKRFKLDPVPLHVMGMADKVGELFLSGGRRGRKEGLPSRTFFSGRSHGGKVGWKKERSIKKKHFQEGGGNFFHFFPGSLQLASKWEALEMSL